LQGADLVAADLQSADLSLAKLQGAGLSAAHLQGANLSLAKLRGADLSYAELQGTFLLNAELQGADLSHAQLQGAYLPGTQLQGACLRFAELQGANARAADISDSDLDGAFVFRAAVDEATSSTAVIRRIHTDKVRRKEVTGETVSLTELDVEGWIAAATASAREQDKVGIILRFARLKAVQPTDQDTSDHGTWAELAKQSLALDPNGAQYRRRLADRLGDLACDAEGAPYVARGLVRSPPTDLDCPSPVARLGDQLERVRKRMKAGQVKPDACKGVAGFTEDDWRRLDAIKPAEAAPANP
jgi:uncharacterized protein YjbI with pentapeptide repeats